MASCSAPNPNVGGGLPTPSKPIHKIPSDDIEETRYLCKDALKKSNSAFAKAIQEDDSWVARFLKAKKKPKKAAAMILAAHEWREENKVESFRDWDLKSDLAEFDRMRAINGVLLGCDKEGHPIIFVDSKPQAQDAVRGMGKSKKAFLDGMELLQIQLQEFLAFELYPERRKKDANARNTATAIVDLSGFRFSHVGRLTYAFGTMVAGIQDERYPNCVAKTYIINAPRVFSMAWKVLKTILPKAVVDSLVFCKKDYLPQLLEAVDKDVLPKRLGGNSPYEIGESPLQKRLDSLSNT